MYIPKETFRINLSSWRLSYFSSSGSMGEYNENEGLASSPLSTHLPVLVNNKMILCFQLR